MKKFWIALILILALAVTCLVGCGSTEEPSNDLESQKENASAVFTLDVNPGVRVYVKEDNTVITVEAVNEDGEEIVSELEIEGQDYGEAVEEIIDKIEEKGYIDGEGGSVLISIEKKSMEISEKINNKINAAFEKHGKKAAVIEQELTELDEKVSRELSELAEKYNISEGKAQMIEKIREEFPELDRGELADLKVNDLRAMLEETSEDVKKHFKRLDKDVENIFLSKAEALENALANIEIEEDAISMPNVRITWGEGKMLFEVSFVYEETRYIITIDAESGTVISTESGEYVEFNPDKVIGDFCDKHNIDLSGIKDQFENIFKPGHGNDENEGQIEEKPISKGDLLKGIFEKLEISPETLKKTDVQLHKGENGQAFDVTITTDSGDVYKIAVEAYTGVIIKAELNGAEIEISVEAE